MCSEELEYVKANIEFALKNKGMGKDVFKLYKVSLFGRDCFLLTSKARKT